MCEVYYIKKLTDKEIKEEEEEEESRTQRYEDLLIITEVNGLARVLALPFIAYVKC